MIKGKTIIKRTVYDKPRRGNKIGSIDANVIILADENRFQWLHLVDGGWVSAGTRQQFIKWEIVQDPVEPLPTVPNPNDSQPPETEPRIFIKGKTIKKREVYNKPREGTRIGMIAANVNITAIEHKIQWLHLADGGWVNAGPRQQYVKWEVVNESGDTPTLPTDSEPVVTPPPPKEPWPITDIKRAGRIATLLVDWQNPKWNFFPRQFSLEGTSAFPQTVTFNSVREQGKGSTIPLIDQMIRYLGSLNGQKTKELILTVKAGWINIPTLPGTVERLSWAGNHVVVKEIRIEADVEYANVYALSCYETDLIGNFFDKDMRLVLHKFNAVTRDSNMIKLANARDCYTPFITDPDVDNGDMWIPAEYLEMWPELPFTLSDGSIIIEYELFGYKIYGLRADGKSVLLRDPSGFKTNWKINSPEVPV